jgi:HSP20 family protein
MLTVKMNRKPYQFLADQLINGDWNEFPALLKQDFNDLNKKWTVPVNVKETASDYQLELVVPGFEKTDFRIDLEKDLLTISGEVKNEVKEENEKLLRKEFQYRSFKRTFTIDEKIDATGIEANYVNGILLVKLPKKAEVKPEAKQIEIK